MESYQSNVTGQILLNIKTVKSKETNLLMPKPNYSTLSQQAPQENIHTSKKIKSTFLTQHYYLPEQLSFPH